MLKSLPWLSSLFCVGGLVHDSVAHIKLDLPASRRRAAPENIQGQSWINIAQGLGKKPEQIYSLVKFTAPANWGSWHEDQYH